MTAASALSSLRKRLSLRHLVLAATIVVATLMAGSGIGKYPFWDDEAETALIARGIAEHGSRSAWTGSNVVAFRGGFDLDHHLIQVSEPPLQYYVAAASFLLLGEGTISGRLPFLLAGLAALWLLHRWAAAYLGPDFPSWLPSLLMALNVPYLLFIAQCRYYALVMAFTAALLWAWAEVGRCKRQGLAQIAGGAAIFSLFAANYIDAIAVAVACTIGSFQFSMRQAPNRVFVVVIGTCLTVCAAYLLLEPKVISAWSALHGPTPPIPHFSILARWELTGLGTFEFFPVMVTPILGLPWLVRSLEPYRPIALRALFVALMILAVIGTIAGLSPQNIHVTDVADMRYVTPVIILGSIITATAVFIVAKSCGCLIATLLTALIVLTNSLYIGPQHLQCTLCERLREITETHPSGTAAMLQAASFLAPGTSVAVFPAYMVRPLMFYRPDLKYPGVLDPRITIAADLRARLPNWVFCCATAPDSMLIGVGSVGSSSDLPTNGSQYRLDRIISLAWLDRTRPELPWHAFRPDLKQDRSRGIVILRRIE